MSGKEGKRAKGRRNLYSHPKNGSTNATPTALGASGGATTTPFQPIEGVMNVSEVTTEFGSTLKSTYDDAERITEMMDAHVDLDIPAHAISRGPNPYLDRCMYCNTPRTASLDGDEGIDSLDLQLDGNTVIGSLANSQSFSSLKLEIWTCASCRKQLHVAGNLQSILASCEVPFLHDKTCIDPSSCAKCQEERDSHERETQELQENWVELRTIVKELYSSEDEPVLSQEQGERLKFLVDKLCSQDPHQLFLRLESQVRMIVTDMKTKLLAKLKEDGYNTPDLALDFTSSLLSHYDLLTKKAHLLAQYLGGLSEHLRRFNVTWELLNKHLFHSIAHNDPAISNSGPTILEQLRQGSVQYEKSRDDPFCVVRKRLLKFQEEMSVVVVVWRDCQQLIESYCQEEVKNTQKQVSSKARSFISQQRQLLKEHLKHMKHMNEPLTGEDLSETMKNLMSGHKSSTEKILCNRCKRERCTCDECTITHMITCGIINSDKGEIPPPSNSFNFALDHTRNVMDITPPSMSSTTSSSGSVSPINIEDKLTTFYDCERALKEKFSDALLNCDERERRTSSATGDSTNDDIDDNAGDDEDDDEDDDVDEDEFPDNQDAGSDEPHALQIPICELKDADALWEAVQQHQQQQLLQQQLNDRLKGIQHGCYHNPDDKSDHQCPFQPNLTPELSHQLELELAKSLVVGAGDSAVGSKDKAVEGGDIGGLVGPGLCATCQCHACLKQSGHIISTSLPLQMPVSSPPAELHLYPHIHGLPHHNQQRYMLDLPSPLLAPIKLPGKLDLDDTGGLQDNPYHAYSDWDNTMQPRPGSLAAQHNHQHHQRLSELLPPAPSAPPFTFDLASHLATHTTHTSTTNTTSAFKSVASKHLASSILPTLNNVGQMASEGSSVDPTKPLDLASLAKIPQACLNSVSSVPPSSFSPSLSFSCSSSTSAPATSMSNMPMSSVISKSTSSCHGPPCSRPAPLGGNVATSKWERNHPQHCKKFSTGSGLLNKQVPSVQAQQQGLGVLPFTGGLPAPPPLPPSSAALKSLFPGHHKDDVLRSLRSALPCSHATNPTTQPAGLAPHPAPATSANTTNIPTSGNPSIPLPCSNSLVNNIGVGTSTPCTDPACYADHLDDNCDSVDSCSEKSSSTSASNQKEGKYCDCCYCEFFGHNNTQGAKTNPNYIEIKDRLRKKLKKRQSENKHKQTTPKNGLVQEGSKEELRDPLEKKGLEGLLSFINGTDEDAQGKSKEKELTAKAAKRARQKQKKLEEKARQEKSSSPSEKKSQPEPEKTLRQLLNQTLNLGNQPGLDPKVFMAKPKFKKQPDAGRNDAEEDKQRMKDIIPSPTKQEINRSSLIIESTRPTISRTPKDPQELKKFFDALQQSLSKNDSSNRTPFGGLNNASSSQGKSNSSVGTPHATKPVSDSGKTNSLAKQLQQQQQPLATPPQQQQRLSQHQKQQQPGKLVNGKGSPISQGPGATNHVANGRSTPSDKRGQSQQHAHLNGGPVKVGPVTPVSSAPAALSTSSSSSKNSVADSPSAGSGSSASQSPSSGLKLTADQGKTNGKAKKNRKKNRNGDISGVDEIFMPKSESDLDGDVDDFERELEEFKRFCFEPAEPKERRKIAVNVNLKDIFKKKTGLV